MRNENRRGTRGRSSNVKTVAQENKEENEPVAKEEVVQDETGAQEDEEADEEVESENIDNEEIQG